MTGLITGVVVTVVGLIGTALLATLGWLVRDSRNEVVRRLEIIEVKLGTVDLKMSSLDIRLTRVGAAVEFLYPPGPPGPGRRWTDQVIDDGTAAAGT